MNRLKQELERKKEENKKKKLILQSMGKKFVKRGEWENLEKHMNQVSDDSSVHEKLAKISTNNDNIQDSNAGKSHEEDKRKVNLTRKEVIRRLREKEEPIRLFGETDYEVFERLRKLEILKPEVNRGLKNDFQDAMNKVDKNYINELYKSTASGADANSLAQDVEVRDEGTTYEEILEMSTKLGTGDQRLDSDVILKYLKLILYMWGDRLNRRSEEMKRCRDGKVASARHVQTVDYLKPLFRKLKKQTISEDIFSCLVDIVKHMIDREYLKANEAYLEMAIGNAAWPIGVTMVGIHARTGREKISARNVAHVLNNEIQRKYIQALKRLMMQAQFHFPTDPSRSIDYTATKDNDF